MSLVKHLASMKHSPISNYAGIPGVTSWLIGTPGPHGLVRLMECSREHSEPVIPHSHRFDFHCQVLRGSVRQILWLPTPSGDEFQATTMRYQGAPGDYVEAGAEIGRWATKTMVYHEDDQYSMKANEIHSIFFGRDTSVLFFEGPPVSETSIILEPYVDGETVPTFKVEPWAFKRGAQ